MQEGRTGGTWDEDHLHARSRVFKLELPYSCLRVGGRARQGNRAAGIPVGNRGPIRRPTRQPERTAWDYACTGTAYRHTYGMFITAGPT